jgi:hypothetical protein
MQPKLDTGPELPRQSETTIPESRKVQLGTILVATGQITQAQLEHALRGQAASGRRLGDELVAGGHASTGQIERGLLLQRKLVAGALVVATMITPLTLMTFPAQAAQSASMQVSAVVIANIKVHTEHQVAELRITDADLARGFIDVPAASRFVVSTNSRSGYRLEFYPIGDLFESVQIEGLGNPASLGPDGGTIVQRGVAQPNTTHELSYRFTLRAGVQPGSYQWPLLLSVRAL